MSRADRTWPAGIRHCSRCGRAFKQGGSLAAHVRVCKGKIEVKKKFRYPPHFRKYLLSIGESPEDANQKI